MLIRTFGSRLTYLRFMRLNSPCALLRCNTCACFIPRDSLLKNAWKEKGGLFYLEMTSTKSTPLRIILDGPTLDGISLLVRLRFNRTNCSNKSFAHNRHEDDPDVKIIRQTGQLNRRVIVRIKRVVRWYPRLPRVVRPPRVSMEPVHRWLGLHPDVVPVVL